MTSVCLTTSESKLLGYNGVSDGKYVRSPLPEAYEFGGVFLLDEIDLGNPGILAVLNQLMAATSRVPRRSSKEARRLHSYRGSEYRRKGSRQNL